MKPTFVSWMKKQTDRNDPIGDFARDTVWLLKHPGHYRSSTICKHSSDFRKWDDNLNLSGCVDESMCDAFASYYMEYGIPTWLQNALAFNYSDEIIGKPLGEYEKVCLCLHSRGFEVDSEIDDEIDDIDGPKLGKQARSRGLAKRFLIMRRDGFRCQICGKSVSDNENVKLEIDHKVPVSKGGSSQIDNLWTLCFECNRGKRDKDLHHKVQP